MNTLQDRTALEVAQSEHRANLYLIHSAHRKTMRRFRMGEVLIAIYFLALAAAILAEV